MNMPIGHWIKHNGEEQSLDGLAFTNRQLFWMAMARVWCARNSDDQLMSVIENNVHSPGMFRIIGMMQNSEYFAKDFGCKFGSPMNPEKKCKMW